MIVSERHGIGVRAPRLEDSRMVTGRGRFIDDLDANGQAYARVVRSEVAHGELRSVRTDAAAALPGVLLAITAADLPDLPYIPVRIPVADVEVDAFRQPVLADVRVRYVGEPVAIVVAEDLYAAEDAAQLVEVDIEPLTALLDADVAEDAPALFAAGNVAGEIERGYGDVESAFAEASHVVEATLDCGRHSGVPLETRGLLADYDPTADRMEIWGSTKVPNFNRRVLADMLGMPEQRIRVHPVDAGGGFGIRGEFYPEDFLVPWLARALRRPVKWIEDRAEHMVAANHSRHQRHRLAMAFDDAGRILAVRDDITHDNGAYIRTHGAGVAELSVAMLPGPYRIPAFRGRVRVALTNRTPCGTYRAPGRYEGTYAREHLLDVAADRMGLDRVELRRRNLLQPSELPHTRGFGVLGTDLVLDEGDYPGLLDQALDHVRDADWDSLKQGIRERGQLPGLGVAMFVEKSGLGPFEYADVRIDRSGAIRIVSAATSLGQGVETVMAQIAAEAFDVDHMTIEVVNGDTELMPYGFGSFASRSTVVVGSAVMSAALATCRRAREVAARMLDVDVEDTRIERGSVVSDLAAAAVTFADVAVACEPGSAFLAPDEPPGLGARGHFATDHMTYPYGVHVGLVAVDAGTGGVTVERYLVAYEVGRAINPTLVEGQLLGGAIQGIGGALLEEFRYDELGQPQSTSFMDYLMPTAAESPVVSTILAEDAPSAGNPLGTKGAGEGGTTAAGATIANAVRDALGHDDALTQLPLTPSRVVAALERVHGAPEIG